MDAFSVKFCREFYSRDHFRYDTVNGGRNQYRLVFPAKIGGSLHGFPDAVDRVVICERDRGKPLARSIIYKLRRCISPVRFCGMGVKVNWMHE